MHSDSFNNNRFNNINLVPVDRLVDPLLERSGVDLHILRLDQYDPLLSGNKYFKLKYNLQHVNEQGYKRIISFGGAYSNHIHALAIAGRQQGLSTIGVIRGEETSILNDTLSDAVKEGMQLIFVDRETYRSRNDKNYWEVLKRQYPESYIIPEGGGNLLGLKGCMDIVKVLNQSLENDFDMVAMSVGTGSTMAGVVAGIAAGFAPEKLNIREVLGISVLKNAQYIEAEVANQLKELPSFLTSDFHCDNRSGWSINHNYHCGGYAKISKELVQFIRYFQNQHNVPIEPVYTGKLFLALYRLIKKGAIENKSIVAIHTGGLQGLRGMQGQMDKYSLQENDFRDIDKMLLE